MATLLCTALGFDGSVIRCNEHLFWASLQRSINMVKTVFLRSATHLCMSVIVRTDYTAGE